MRIALAGNPNSGKTSMYNELTGSRERVGNWAGVTVDKKESALKKMYCKGKEEVIVVDLPGAYSMSPFTSEESVTRDYIQNENPDVLINIVDATNLSRSLFLPLSLWNWGFRWWLHSIRVIKTVNLETQLIQIFFQRNLVVL